MSTPTVAPGQGAALTGVAHPVGQGSTAGGGPVGFPRQRGGVAAFSPVRSGCDAVVQGLGVNPAIEQLCRFGFSGERLFNQDGHLDLVYYTRDFRGVREVVLVYSERKALAYRTRDMLDPDSPWHVTESTVEWRLHGDVVTVVNALLSLPAPGPPSVPTQATVDKGLGCPE